jgi:E3 ubiquitin-protein ligase Topors
VCIPSLSLLFYCPSTWPAEQSRRCPLCSQSLGEYVIHHIRSKYDYQKRFLPPLRTSPEPPARPPTQSNNHLSRAERERGRRYRRERDEADELERAIAKRRWIYEHDLYAKHIASNSFTKYRPYPTPAQFSASSEFISRTTSFIRRELQVWVNLDVEVRYTHLRINLISDFSPSS